MNILFKVICHPCKPIKKEPPAALSGGRMSLAITFRLGAQSKSTRKWNKMTSYLNLSFLVGLFILQYIAVYMLTKRNNIKK
jgi:hypothetical protein